MILIFWLCQLKKTKTFYDFFAFFIKIFIIQYEAYNDEGSLLLPIVVVCFNF